MSGDAVNAADETRGALLPDKATAAEQVEAAYGQFCELLRTTEDMNLPAVGQWSVGDVAAHVAAGASALPQIAAGEGSPYRSATVEGIAESNDRLKAETDTRDIQALVDRIRLGAKALTSAALAQHGDPTVPHHAGIPVPVSAVLGLAVGEALVHGYDIAHANGRPWRIPRAWAYTAFRSFVPIVPYFVDQDRVGDMRARFDVRMRGDGAPRVVFDLADGELTIQLPEPGRRADCYVSAESTALLLVMYGRIGPAVPALTGKVLAWGRKPWLGFTLPTLFQVP
jgi:uncharacterized protein (TIGR03083 family)